MTFIDGRFATQEDVTLLLQTTVPAEAPEDEPEDETPLCACGCGQRGLSGERPWADGHFKKAMKTNRRLVASIQKDTKFRKNSDGLVFRCALHPDWQADNRADRDRHFKTH